MTGNQGTMNHVIREPGNQGTGPDCLYSVSKIDSQYMDNKQCAKDFRKYLKC